MNRNEKCKDCIYKDAPVSLTCMTCNIPVKVLMGMDERSENVGERCSPVERP